MSQSRYKDTVCSCGPGNSSVVVQVGDKWDGIGLKSLSAGVWSCPLCALLSSCAMLVVVRLLLNDKGPLQGPTSSSFPLPSSFSSPRLTLFYIKRTVCSLSSSYQKLHFYLSSLLPPKHNRKDGDLNYRLVHCQCESCAQKTSRPPTTALTKMTAPQVHVPRPEGQCYGRVCFHIQKICASVRQLT